MKLEIEKMEKFIQESIQFSQYMGVNIVPLGHTIDEVIIFM